MYKLHERLTKDLSQVLDRKRALAAKKDVVNVLFHKHKFFIEVTTLCWLKCIWCALHNYIIQIAHHRTYYFYEITLFLGLGHFCCKKSKTRDTRQCWLWSLVSRLLANCLRLHTFWQASTIWNSNLIFRTVLLYVIPFFRSAIKSFK